LVVGLVVGAVGGYFVASSSLQPKIDGYESQVAELNSEVSDLSTTVSSLESSLEDEIADHELQVFHLIEEIQVLESLTSDMQSELNELEIELKFAGEEIYLAGNRIEGLEDAIEWYQGELLSSEAEIARLQDLLTDKFAMYGFSFEYPEGWSASVSGMFESVASEDSGLVVLSSADEESVFSVGWWLWEMSIPDLEGTLDDDIEGMISELPGVELGERVETIFVGEYGIEHLQRYQTGAWLGYDLIFTAWYCGMSNYFFLAMLIEPGPADMLATLSTLMETFECH